MKINTNLNYVNYITCVEAIADGYFDENGNYAPHIGRAIELAVFLDYCVDEIDIDREAPDLIDKFYQNDELMEAYGNALYGWESFEGLNFQNAHNDAMNIVNYRKSSMVQAISMLGGIMQQVMSPDNLEKIYALSDRFKEVIGSQDNNITELFSKKDG